MFDRSNNIIKRTGFVASSATSTTCDVVSGETGIWCNNGVWTVRNADGTDSVIGSDVQGRTILAADVVIESALPASTYANGTAGVGATLTANGNGVFGTYDGVTSAANLYYLVTAQAAPAQNGLYKLTTRGTAGTQAVLTRAVDFDTADEMLDGVLFVVKQGTARAGTLWENEGDVTTVGTTSVTISRQADVVTLATAQTITGAKDFAAGTLKADNNSTTNAHTFVSAATAARNVTLPDASFTVPQDSLVVHLAGAETITGAKDFAAGALKCDNNSTTNAHTFVSAATAARNVTLPDATFTVPQDSLVAHLAGAENITGVKTFTNAARPLINNAADTFSTALTSAATANRTATFPDADDTLVGLAATQTLTNKTLTTQVVNEGLTATGSGSNDFSASTGTFKTSSGANTFNGTVAIAANKNIGCAAGTTAVDFAPGTGYFAPCTVADDNLGPGGEVIHKFMVASGVTGNVDFVITKKTEILDVHLIKTNGAGGGAGTVQVTNNGTAITDAMSIDIADKTIARCTQIDDAQNVIAAGGTLRIVRTRTASSDETCIVVVRGILRA